MSTNLIQLKGLIKSVVKEHTRKNKSGKVSQVRQHEDKRQKKAAESKGKGMSSGLSSIIEEVAKHDSVKSAYTAFKHRTGIPREVADEFFQKFGEKGVLDPEEAFKNLYKYAKKGDSKSLSSLPEGERKGLMGWVDTYKQQRKHGNVKGAKATKKNIDKAIKKHGLNSNEVYGLKKSVASSGIYLIKSRVKGHIRRTKSGKVVNVKEHTDSRRKATKKPAARKKVAHEYRGHAEEIRKQIGSGAMFMMGAKNVGKGHNEDGTEYLSFKIGRNSKGVTYVKVTLNVNDEYDVEFGKVGRGSRANPGPTYRVLNNVNGIQADQLHETIEQNTGLYLSMGNMRGR
ncbi:hypothetical protein KAR91_36935 [Candidatus Pacearchaeota archaeon]|nr:hypothetical protein [Candidatus Pacearchaeota archaeon]